MKYCENILETIGNTPLVRLRKVAKNIKPVLLEPEANLTKLLKIQK